MHQLALRFKYGKSPVLSQSEHAEDADECPFSGVRLSFALGLPKRFHLVFLSR